MLQSNQQNVSPEEPSSNLDLIVTPFRLLLGPPPLSASELAGLYPTELTEPEKLWRDRYNFFRDKKKLLLRPRYSPEWKPSWMVKEQDPAYCEDAITLILPMILDARDEHGRHVCLKYISKRTQEVDVARFFSSDGLRGDEKNHCVFIYDAFQDPYDSAIDYLVMPVLRPYNDPNFWAIGEIVDFTTQILEGLTFMHSHGVAHGDLTGANVMMDGRPLYPRGWHFVADSLSPDGCSMPTPLTRIDNPVRYFIVDFGCSIRFLPGQSRLIAGEGGRDQEAPELALYRPYDAFKLDVFTTGNMLLKDCYKEYEGLDFLTPLIDSMMLKDPQLRPTAHTALEQWYKIRASLSVTVARWRLQKPEETAGERVVLNTVAAARQGMHNLKSLFRDQPRTWENP